MGHAEDLIEDPVPARRAGTARHGRADRSPHGDATSHHEVSNHGTSSHGASSPGTPRDSVSSDSISSDNPSSDNTVADIIAEFSEVFAFARTRWAKFAEEASPELRGAGIMILQTIKRKGPVTATGISQLLDMDKAVVSRQITKLRELGFVDAEPAPDDGRVTLLAVSEGAQEILDGIRARWAHTYHERFEGWNEEELELLRAGLHRFNAAAANLRTDGPAVRCARDAQA